MPNEVSYPVGIMGKPKRFQSPARQRALAVLARMRNRGESLSEAARNEHTTVRTVRRHVGSALTRDSRTRHFAAKSGDTFRRDLSVLAWDGYLPVSVRSSKQAHFVSEHLSAVNRFLRTGESEGLKPFVGKRVGGIELLTDLDRLYELADAGLVKLDNLYRQNRGGTEEK